MAATTYGTAHIYGVSGTITNATVLSTNLNKSFGVNGVTKNESGHEIERRYDDLRTEGTITLKVQSGYTVQAQGTTIAYDSTTYEVTSVSISESNQDYKTVQYSVLESESISYV